MPVSGEFLHQYISDAYEFLTEEDKGLLSTFWSSLIQAAGAIEQTVLETTLSGAVDFVPDLSIDRWNNYSFNSSSADIGSSEGATATVDGAPIDGEPLSFSTPGSTENLAHSILISQGLLVAHRYTGQRFTLGQDFSVDALLGQVTHVDGGAIPVGQSLIIRYSYMADVGPVAGFPYAMTISSNIKEIPVLQDALVSPTITLYENADYKVYNGYLAFSSVPPLSLWAEMTLIDDQTAYRNFGHWIEFFLDSSPEYVNALQALYYAYFTGAQKQTIEQAVASLLGLPIARTSGLVVSAVNLVGVTVPISRIDRPYKVVTDGSEDLTDHLTAPDDHGESSLIYITGVGGYADSLSVSYVVETELLLESDAFSDYVAPAIGLGSIVDIGGAPGAVADDPLFDVESAFSVGFTCRISGSAIAANNVHYEVGASYNQGAAGSPDPTNAIVVLSGAIGGIEAFSGATLTSTEAKIYIPRQIRVSELDEDGEPTSEFFSQIVHDGLTATVGVGDTVGRFQALTDGVELIDKVMDVDFVINEVGRSGVQRFLTDLATTGPGNTDETLALELLRSHLWVARIHGSVFNYLITYGDIHNFLKRIKPVYTEYILQILESFEEGIEIGDIELPLEFILDLTETVSFNYPNHLEFGVNMPIVSFTQAPPRITIVAPPHDMRAFANVGEEVEVAGLPADNGTYAISAVDAVGGAWIDVTPTPTANHPAPVAADVFVHGTDAEYTAAGGYPYLDISAGHVNTNDEAEAALTGTGWPIYSFIAPPSFSRSLHFTAANSETVEIAHAAAIDFDNADPFSVSVWVHRPAAGVANMFISKATAAGQGWAIGITAANKIEITLWNGVAGEKIVVESDSAYATTGAWMHFVVTYDGSGDAAGVKLYATTTALQPPSPQHLSVTDNNLQAGLAHANPMHIGSVHGGAQFFEGYIDEVSVWNVELTVDEIEELDPGFFAVHLGLHSRVDNLVAWWRMGEHANDAADGSGVLVPGVLGVGNQITDVASTYKTTNLYYHGNPTSNPAVWQAPGIDAQSPPSIALTDGLILVERPGSAQGPPNPYSGGDMIDLVHELGDEITVTGSPVGANNTTFTISGFFGTNGLRVLPVTADDTPDTAAVYGFEKTKAI
jgi:hypothetical protein